MKKLMICVALGLAISSIFATVWHVNNNAALNADFTELGVACADPLVSAGDTLYIYGSPVSYGSIALGKRLTLIGPGYFLGENAGLQSCIIPATITNIQFSTGSEGSLISGLTISDLVQVNVDNVVIQRNNIARMSVTGDNCIVLQNFFLNAPYGGFTIFLNGAINYLLANNFLDFSRSGWCILSDANSGGVIANCIITGSCQLYNADVYNCIIEWNSNGWEWTFAFDANTSFHHNVFREIYSWNWNTTVNVQGVGNLYNVSAGLYVATGSTDGYYQLCTDSPAAGAGLNGQDCGIFGGQDPYRLSGIPAIPTIYEFFAPSTGFVIPIQLRARSNN